MSEFSSDNPPRARIGQRTVIVPLPAPRPAWFVWESSATEPDGPYEVVGIAYLQTWTEADARVREPGSETASGRPFEAVAEVASYDGAELDSPVVGIVIRFVVLPDNPGEWDSLVIEPRFVYFSKQAAREALEKRRGKG